MSDIQNQSTPIRVFLSYARADDEPFVKRLYADLVQAGFTVWFDRESLMSRGISFHQEIEDAIRTEVDRVVYIGGPKAALSPYVRGEWQFALKYDHVVVTPILRLGDYERVPGELSLLHCEDFRDDADYPAALAKLIASLRQPNPKFGALFAVPSLPPNFLGRPELMRRVRDALLVDLQKPQVITGADARVGMQGMGGIGKSVLAASLARNRQVRQSYPDGVVWIAAGQKLTDDDLLKRQRDLARHLGGDDTFASLAQGQGVLRQLLAAKAVLLVLDDVWQAADAQAFDVLGPRCRMLVTTRDKGILDALHGELIPVSLFTEPEALQLLADAVNVAPAALPAEAREVACKCGLLPLALALCGGMARKRGGDFHSVLERLRRADLEKIADRQSINEQHRSIWRAMQASVEMLPEDEQQRFAELSVFVTDQNVPEAAAVTLWLNTGGFDDLDTEELLINLFERSLIQLDQKTEADGKVRRRFRLHDLLHDYAVRIAGEPRSVHQKLLDAYRMKCLNGWPSGPDDGYFLQNLVLHLIAAESIQEATSLLFDFSWIRQQCAAGLVLKLIQDYGNILSTKASDVVLHDSLKLIRDTIRLCSHIIQKDPAQLPSQLFGRTRNTGSPFIDGLLVKAMNDRSRAWLRPQSNVLTQVGSALIQTLSGHTKAVYCLALTPDGGHVLSGSLDATLRLWELSSGRCVQVLRSEEYILSVAIAPDGRIAATGGPGHNCGILSFWDLSTGQRLRVCRGHQGGITCLSFTPDGRRVVTGSIDRTLRLWDVQTGEALKIFEDYPAFTDVFISNMPSLMTKLAQRSDALSEFLWTRLSTESKDALASAPASESAFSELLSKLAADMTQVVNGPLIYSPDLFKGINLSLTTKNNLSEVLEKKENYVEYTPALNRRLLEDAYKPAAYWPSPDQIQALTVTPDGKYVVWSDGDMLIFSDATSGRRIRRLEASADWGRDSITRDGVFSVAKSHDKVLRFHSWTGAPAEVFERGKSRWLTLSPDGQFAVTFGGSESEVVEIASAKVSHVLGHSAVISCIVVTNDNSIAVSGSEDATLCVWNLHSQLNANGTSQDVGRVNAIRITPDGRCAVSGGNDSKLHHWDPATGRCLRSFDAGGKINCVALTPDGQIVVAGCSSRQGAVIRVWNLETGFSTTLPTEANVESIFLTDDGNLALSGSDDFVLRLWDLKTNKCIATLSGHSAPIERGGIINHGNQAISVSRDLVMKLWDIKTANCIQTKDFGAALDQHLQLQPDLPPSEVNMIRKNAKIWGFGVTPSGIVSIVGLQNRHTPSLAALTPQGNCILEGHTDLINCVTATKDFSYIVSGSDDCTVRVWQPERQNSICQFTSAKAITACAVTESARKIAVGEASGRVYFLDMVLPEDPKPHEQR